MALILSCATPPPPPPPPPTSTAKRPDPFPIAHMPEEPPDPTRTSTKGAVLLRGATVMTAAGPIFDKGHVLIVDGKIASVGAGAGTPPSGASVVDATGMYITPGI